MRKLFTEISKFFFNTGFQFLTAGEVPYAPYLCIKNKKNLLAIFYNVTILFTQNKCDIFCPIFLNL
jgi:hypothetical protein